MLHPARWGTSPLSGEMMRLGLIRKLTKKRFKNHGIRLKTKMLIVALKQKSDLDKTVATKIFIKQIIVILFCLLCIE